MSYKDSFTLPSRYSQFEFGVSHDDGILSKGLFRRVFSPSKRIDKNTEEIVPDEIQFLRNTYDKQQEELKHSIFEYSAQKQLGNL